MRYVNSSMRFIFFLIAIFAASTSFAHDEIVVVKAEGSVATNDASGKQEKAVASKSTIPRNNVLVTGPNGRAVVRVGQAGYIVVEKNSKIEISNTKDRAGFLRQITGMIYYALNSVKGEQRLEVRTPTATLGIRGTRFLVTDMPDRSEIGMRKGLINVASPEGDFEIHKKSEQDEFEAYQQEARDAIAKEKRQFDAYKSNTEREFIEYKREFSLGANRMASFDGKRVVDRPLSAESKKDMESVEAYAEEWIKQVHD